jgi:ribosome-associated translation inhibitor RaiA
VVDKRCRIDVRLKRGAELTVNEIRSDIFASLAVALDRLKAVIGRKVGKAKRGIGAS